MNILELFFPVVGASFFFAREISPEAVRRSDMEFLYKAPSHIVIVNISLANILISFTSERMLNVRASLNGGVEQKKEVSSS